ncbi:MAG: site-specific tyrosine recombinase XerD [Coriobacteriia bacterium]|nr:site-specific tyrosine recombinase XerD [Coriobacteriia bacterium]MCL2536994.1 site-specific tyrosine recombinase XerD [Coriobacteriia bacterium]
MADHSGKQKPPLYPEFEAARDRFISALTLVQNKSEKTAQSYRSDLDVYYRWAQRGKLDPLTVQYRQLRRYLAEQSSAQYARSTIARRLSTLRSFFHFLQQEGSVDSNPATLLQTPKKEKMLPHTLSQTEMDALLEISDTNTPEGMRDTALLELLYASGGRVSEIAGLRTEDLKLDQGIVRIEGKGGKDRYVPLHGLAIRKLENYLASARPVFAAKVPSTELVFLSSRGNPLSADAIRRIVKKSALLAGITRPVSPHSFRHSFASDLLNNGADLRSVQELLGHANLSTTQIYTHLSAKRLQSIHEQAHPRS